MIVVKLDNEKFGAGPGPGTVVACVESVEEGLRYGQDRDGARDADLRIWAGDFHVGSQVSLMEVANDD